MGKRSRKQIEREYSKRLEDHLYHLPNEGPGYDDLKQLYAWTFADAEKTQEEWENRNKRGRGPLFRWIGAQELKELFEVYRTGNIKAIIEALFVCCLNSLPIPRWCENGYLSAYRKVRQYKAKSWDDVFGQPHPKGMHIAPKRQEREFGWKVYRRIQQIKKDHPSTAIDGALFERVGREFAIGGKTLVEEYYYKEKKGHRSLEDSFNKKV